MARLLSVPSGVRLEKTMNSLLRDFSLESDWVSSRKTLIPRVPWREHHANRLLSFQCRDFSCERCATTPSNPPDTRCLQETVYEGKILSLSCALIANRCSKTRAGFSPKAHVGDGLMDLCVVQECSRFNFLQFLAAIGNSFRIDPVCRKFSPSQNFSSRLLKQDLEKVLIPRKPWILFPGITLAFTRCSLTSASSDRIDRCPSNSCRLVIENKIPSGIVTERCFTTAQKSLSSKCLQS